jgi:beta-lactam-binding protein with PASTA domain
MTIQKPASKKVQTESSNEYLVERVINAGSPPPGAAPVEEKEIKFQMVISPELCRSIDDARKLSKTSRRAWLLQAAIEKLDREGRREN